MHDDEREKLELQLLQLRDELIGAEAKLGELREQVQRLKARCQRTEDLCELRVANIENELAVSRMYEQQLEMVLGSTSWRVGRAIVKPTFALRRMLGTS
jgi:predicted  nucleic acid-binding Zn-ribbon protein